jgi:hypothetical protein
MLLELAHLHKVIISTQMVHATPSTKKMMIATSHRTEVDSRFFSLLILTYRQVGSDSLVDFPVVVSLFVIVLTSCHISLYGTPMERCVAFAPCIVSYELNPHKRF